MRGGNSHEDVGYGSSENLPTDAAAIDTALKTAISDALKRALRVYGDGLGNCLANDEYRKQLKAGGHRDQELITTHVDRMFLETVNSVRANASSLLPRNNNAILKFVHN